MFVACPSTEATFVALAALSLRWNLHGERPLEFGTLISSSNELVNPRVTVETSAPLLWTTGLKAR